MSTQLSQSTLKTDESKAQTTLNQQATSLKQLSSTLTKLSSEKKPTGKALEAVASSLTEAYQTAQNLLKEVTQEVGQATGPERTKLEQAASKAAQDITSIQTLVGDFNANRSKMGSYERLNLNMATGVVTFKDVKTDPVMAPSQAQSPSVIMTAAMTQDDNGPSVLDTVLPKNLSSEPWYNTIKSAIQATKTQLASEAASKYLAAQSTLIADNKEKPLSKQALQEGEKTAIATALNGTQAKQDRLTFAQEVKMEQAGGGITGEGTATAAGEGTGSIWQKFIANLQSEAAQKQGATSTGNGSTSKSATKTTASSTAAKASGGGSTVTSTGSGNTASTPSNNNAPPPVSSTVEASPPPLGGDINGFLMFVLLECYQSGQNQLEQMAERLQQTNDEKNQIRASLLTSETADQAQENSVGVANYSGPSVKTDNLTQQLDSIGDDQQMQQLQLQDLANNQSQLLQMISEFSKNINTNALAIIRNIAG